MCTIKQFISIKDTQLQIMKYEIERSVVCAVCTGLGSDYVTRIFGYTFKSFSNIYTDRYVLGGVK